MAKPYFDEETERVSPAALAEWQFHRLRETVERAYAESRFYRALYEEGGVTPAEIQSLPDVQNLPFLDAESLRDAYPHGLIAAPRRQLRDVYLASGQGGRNNLVFATKKDHRLWGHLVARTLWMQGLRDGDILLNAQPGGLSGAVDAIHLGVQCLGALAVSVSDEPIDHQIDALFETGASAVATSGSHALALLARAEERGIDMARRSSRLRLVALSQDADTAEAESRIQDGLGIPVLTHYSRSELLPACLASQCSEKAGLHVWGDGFLVECVDPRTGDWTPPGKAGEIVWTALQSDGCAVIRFRSGDVSSLLPPDPCLCGRTHPRLGPILGRLADAVSVSGILLFPHQVEAVLRGFPEFGGAFHLKVERPRALDRFTIQAELVEPDMASDRTLTRRLIADISGAVQAATRVSPLVELLPPGGLAALDAARPAARRRRARAEG